VVAIERSKAGCDAFRIDGIAVDKKFIEYLNASGVPGLEKRLILLAVLFD
jgi:hypothetical protein